MEHYFFFFMMQGAPKKLKKEESIGLTVEAFENTVTQDLKNTFFTSDATLLNTKLDVSVIPTLGKRYTTIRCFLLL